MRPFSSLLLPTLIDGRDTHGKICSSAYVRADPSSGLRIGSVLGVASESDRSERVDSRWAGGSAFCRDPTPAGSPTPSKT